MCIKNPSTGITEDQIHDGLGIFDPSEILLRSGTTGLFKILSSLFKGSPGEFSQILGFLNIQSNNINILNCVVRGPLVDERQYFTISQWKLRRLITYNTMPTSYFY